MNDLPEKKPVLSTFEAPPDAAPGPVDGEYQTPEMLAKDLGVSLRTLKRWHIERKGPPRTVIGRLILYKRTSVRSWLESREEDFGYKPRVRRIG